MSVMAQPYKCDAGGCEHVRESDANHWWLLWVSRHAASRYEIHLLPWSAMMAAEPYIKHYCGLEHALAAVASEAQKITDEMTRKQPAAEVPGKGSFDAQERNTDAV